MKNELGIEVCCKNCIYYFRNDIGRVLCDKGLENRCKEVNLKVFRPRISKLEERIKELQEQQFTEKEAEKIETFLTHGYQMMINKNKKIFSKLEKIKGTL